MEAIAIAFAVTSRFTGQLVDSGTRVLRLIDKRKSPKDHQREVFAFLRNMWAPAAYEISVNWAPVEDPEDLYCWKCWEKDCKIEVV